MVPEGVVRGAPGGEGLWGRGGVLEGGELEPGEQQQVYPH